MFALTQYGQYETPFGTHIALADPLPLSAKLDRSEVALDATEVDRFGLPSNKSDKLALAQGVDFPLKPLT